MLGTAFMILFFLLLFAFIPSMDQLGSISDACLYPLMLSHRPDPCESLQGYTNTCVRHMKEMLDVILDLVYFLVP